MKHCLGKISNDSYVIMLTPEGKTYNQTKAKQLVNKKHIILLCGHYVFEIHPCFAFCQPFVSFDCLNIPHLAYPLNNKGNIWIVFSF